MLKRLSYFIFLVCLLIGGVSLWNVVFSSVVTLTVVYVLLPLLYKTCPSVPRHLIFLNNVCHPFVYNLKDPSKSNLHGVESFRLTVKEGVTLGLWHMLPLPLEDNTPAPSRPTTPPTTPPPGSSSLSPLHQRLLRESSAPVVLYLHGNTSNRGGISRVGTYTVLRNLGYHVVTIDYRGYGDSSPLAPTEEGVVEDALASYQWLCGAVGRRVVVWGHSLGTGVASHMAARLATPPLGIILEAPFNNIADEVTMHPLTAVFRAMPHFDWLFLEPLQRAGVSFASDKHLQKVACPILLLHAEDDLVVPYCLGRRLHDTLLATRAPHLPPVAMLSFAAQCRLGHKWIHRSPRLPPAVREFVDKCFKQN